MDDLRLWRARRQHDHIDAVLRPGDGDWLLEYSRNDKVLLEKKYRAEEAARADAASTLKELQRVGWIDHW